MKIGIPKEIKNQEYRVSVTPAGVQLLTSRGHNVFVEKTAGLGSGFKDESYTEAGATLLDTHEEVFKVADMIVKVKEPIKSEYPLIRSNQIIFTYFHFASSLELTQAMIESNAICISYETVELADGSLPLLTPMSEVAGRLAVQEGAKYLEKNMGGKGVLLGGVPGAHRGKVMILGGGTVGMQAASMASGLGADVTILDINLERLRYLEEIMPKNVSTLFSNEYHIRQLLPEQDLVIGAVLITGAKAPHLLTRDMLPLMQAGSVVVDVAVDQGGCIETCRPTTHEEPTFLIDDIIHYCVANMPGSVPRTSTFALTHATLPFVANVAAKGWKEACRTQPELYKGANIINGKVIYAPIASTFGLPYQALKL